VIALSRGVARRSWLTVAAARDRERRSQELADQEIVQSRDFLRATLDSLVAHVAVLDAEGEIILTNRAWTRFAIENGATARGSVQNYLAVSDAAAGEQKAVEAAAGLRAIISGLLAEFWLEYPCHSPTLERWCLMHATRYTGPGEARVVVVHVDVAPRVVSQRALVSERKARKESVQHDIEELALIKRVEDALAQERLLLYAQPIVDLQTLEIVQRELLLRVREPDGNVVGPGAYLPVAEQCGLIGDIDRWVIRRGVEIAATGCPVQLNVSAHSISDRTVLNHIESCIEQTGADPTLLVFEITETALVRDEAAASAFAERLHSLGCRLALDDFGTGYGAFTFLKQLPIDYLKIDVEFVSDLANNTASRRVVQAVVALAQAFSLQTVGEGVEDAETLTLLRELGVDYAQGYHIARPGPLEPERFQVR
jgi:EAL domain-containing protein (putative c-di-GMP-specific phosphodiesterase class I)